MFSGINQCGNLLMPFHKSITVRLLGKNCWYCGGEACTLDHVKSKCKGGVNTRFNRVPACVRCNLAKAAYGLEEFREVLKFRRLKQHQRIYKKPFFRDKFYENGFRFWAEENFGVSYPDQLIAIQTWSLSFSDLAQPFYHRFKEWPYEWKFVYGPLRTKFRRFVRTRLAFSGCTRNAPPVPEKHPQDFAPETPAENSGSEQWKLNQTIA